MPNLPYVSPELVEQYQKDVLGKGSVATGKRKVASLKKFFDFTTQKGYTEVNPFQDVTPSTDTQPVMIVNPDDTKRSKGFFSASNFLKVGLLGALVVLIFLLLGKLKFPIPFIFTPAKETTVVTEIPEQVTTETKQVTTLSPWTIFAKLGITTSGGVTSTGSQSIAFKLYNAQTGGQMVWSSDAKNYTPDADGNILISLDDVPTETFFQNELLFLAPVVGGTELSERIWVASANTATKLKNYSASTEATENTIPVIDANGSLNLASESPVINAANGNLLIEGQAVTITTPDSSDGNIVISPDGSGKAQFIFEGSTGNLLNVTGSNLNSGSLIGGNVNNNSTGYYLLKLGSGSTPTTKFSVDALGNTQIAGDLNVSKDIATGGTDRLSSAGALQNITGYNQTSGNFSITQKDGETASIYKNTKALSDLLTITLDERSKGNSIYSALTLKRYDGAKEGMALFVDEGNARFDGQILLGGYTANPTSVGNGSVVYNTTDNTPYFWNGTSWVSMGGSGANYWRITDGSLAPINESFALNVGSTASASAFFHAPGTNNNDAWFNLGTGNLGVGTTTPGYDLEVVGTGYFSDDVRIGNGTFDNPSGSADMYVTGNLEVDGTLYATSIIGALSGIGTSNYIPVWSGTSSQTNSNIYFDGTNVGIGTSVPTKGKLNILGSVAIGSTAYTEDAGAAPTNGLIVEGNLGIGTTSPLTAIHTTGDLTVLGDDIYMGTNTAGYILLSDGTNFSPTALSGDVTINGSGVTAIGADRVTEAMLDVAGSPSDELCLTYEESSGKFEWQSCASGSLTGSGTDNYLARWNGTSALEASSIYDIGTAVGIGTSLPLQLLQINQTAANPFVVTSTGNIGIGITNPSASLAIGTTAVGEKFTVEGTTGNTIVGGTLTVNGDTLGTGSTAFNLLNTTATNINIGGAGTTIGIGSTAGTTTINNQNTVITGNLDVNGSTNDIAGTLNLSGNTLTSSGDLTIDPTGGGVRIGTGTTQYVDMAGDDLYVTGDLEVGGTIYGSVYGTVAGTGTSNYIPVWSSSTSQTNSNLYQNSLGNVGIGTTAPGTKLDVAGGITGTGLTIGSLTGILKATTGGVTAATGTANYLPKWSATDPFLSATSLVFDNGTGVGIGTTAPSQTLGIGNTGAEVFTVSGTTGNIITTGTLAVNGNSITSSGDLTITPAGGQLILDGSLNTGGLTNVAYNAFANAGEAPDEAGITSDNDLYIGGDLEVDGVIYGTISGGLTGSGTSNYIPVWSGSSSFTNSNLYFDGTNIGIGTTTPAAKLDVNGNIAALDVVIDGLSGNIISSNSVETSIEELDTRLYNQQFNTKEPTGFPNRTDTTISFNDASPDRTFTVTGTNFKIYSKGKEYTKNTETIQVDAATGIYFIYYDAANLNLTQSNSPWSMIDGTVSIATVYWDGTNGLVGDERHGLTMDGMTHEYLHNTVGTRYNTGLTGSFTDTTFSIDPGSVYDEDLKISNSGTETTTRVIYKNGSAAYTFTTEGTLYYYTSGGDLYYNNGTALTAVPSNNYVAYWIFETNDPTTPIYSLMGQRIDGNLANAQNNNRYESLTLGSLPFKEMKLLYRVILRNDATPYEEALDMRSVSNLPSGTYVATAHSVLTGLTTGDDHTQYALLAGRTLGQTLIGSIDTNTGLTLQSTSGVGSTGADIKFKVGSNGNLEAMRILNSGNVGIGFTNPSQTLGIGNTGAELFTVAGATGNIVTAGTLAVNGDAITSDADLTITPSGGQLILADTATINIGGLIGYAWNSLASGTDAKDEAAIAADNDLYIGGDLEVDGTIYGNVSGTVTGSGTSNYIPVFSGTSALTNSILYQDTTNSRIGIGTTAPEGKFEVRGTRTELSSDFNLALSSNYLVVDPATTSTATFVGQINQAATSTNPVVVTGTLIGASNEATTGGNDNIAVTNLIGTYSQGYVVGGTATNVYGEKIRLDPGDGTIINGYGLYIGDVLATNRTFGIYQEGTDDKNYFGGSVGIGTTSPLSELDVRTGNIGIGTTMAATQKLDIQGNMRLTGAFYDSQNSVGSAGQVLTTAGVGLGTTWTSVSALSVGNADTLDGLDSTQFLRSDTSDSFTSGVLTLGTGTTLDAASGSTVDINGDLLVSDTSIAFDGASTTFALTGALAVDLKNSTVNAGSIETNLISFDTSNSRTGIGTTAPSNLLQIGTPGTTAGTLSLAGAGSGLVTLGVGTTAGTWSLTLPTTDGDLNQVLITDGSGNTSWSNITGISGVTGTGTSNYIPVWSSTSALTNSMIYQDSVGSRLGFGTTAPEGRFEFVQSANGTSAFDGLYLRNASGGNIGGIYIDANGYINLDNDDNTAKVLLGSALFADSDADRVGIGTSVPSTTLGVGNTGAEVFTVSGTTGNIVTTGTLAVNGDIITSDGDLTIDSAGGDVTIASGDNLNLTASTNLFFGAVSLGSTSAANTSGASVVGVFDEFNYSNSINVQDVLDDLDAQMLTLTGSAGGWTDDGSVVRLSTVDDKVGIGTTAPGSTLGVVGGVGIGTTDTGGFANAAITNYNLAIQGNIGIGLTSPQTSLAIGTTSTPKFTVAGATGDTVISGTLGVTGVTTLGGVAAGTDNTVLVLNSSNQVIQDEIDARVWGSTLMDGSSLTANYLTKASDGDTLVNSQVFDNATNVGIGTSVPTKGKLNVLGSVAIGSTAYTETAGSAPTNGLIVEGNVGIGITNPAAKLDVNASSGTAIDISNTGTATDIILQNDETIDNNVNGTIQLTATTTALSGDLTVTGNDITFGNGETISNATDGTLLLTSPVVTFTALNDIDFNTPMIDLSNQLTRMDLKDTSVTSFYIENGLLSFDTSNSRVGVSTTGPGAQVDISMLGAAGQIAFRASGASIITNVELDSQFDDNYGTPNWDYGSGTHAWGQGQAEVCQTESLTPQNLVLDPAYMEPIYANRTYKVTWQITSYTARSIWICLGAADGDGWGGTGNCGASRSAVGTYTEYIVAPSNDPDLYFYPGNYDFDGCLSNVYVNDMTSTEIASSTGYLGVGVTSSFVGASLVVGNVAETHTLSDGDVLVQSDVEIDGTLYLDGELIADSGGTTTIQFATTPADHNNYNLLTNGGWLVQNTINNGIAALMVDQTKGGDIFSASKSGAMKVVIDTNGYMGIGTSIGTAMAGLTDALTVSNSTNADIRAINTGNGGSGSGGGLFLEQHKLATSTLTGERLGFIAFAGIGTTDATPTHQNAALIGAYAGGDWSGTSVPTDLAFEVTPSGSTTRAEKMRLTSAGYLGIGTTAPDSNLEVVGASASNATLWISAYAASDTIEPQLLLQKSGTDTLESLSATADQEYLGEITWRGVSSTPNLKTAARIRGVQDGDAVAGAVSAAITFHTANTGESSTSERMRLTKDGYLGIGTTAPASMFQIAGTGTSVSGFYLSSTLSGGAGYGMRISPTFSDKGTGNNIYGMDLRPTVGWSTTASLNNYFNFTSIPQIGTGSSGPISNLFAGYFRNDILSKNSPVTSSTGVWIANPGIGSTANNGLGTITNNYGLYVADMVSGSSTNYGVYSVGGNNYFGGNVGIGTTAPAQGLTLGANYDMLLIDGGICADESGGTACPAINDGDIRWDTTGSAFDLAEYYYTDHKLEAGDIVAAANVKNTVSESSSPYQANVMGVISTNPNLVFGIRGAGGVGEEFAGTGGSDTVIENNRAPVVLSGRSPLKVLVRNGDNINNGDLITSSDLPGVGMKSTETGRTVGTALESTTDWNDTKCSAVSSLSDIIWPEDDGSNSNKPCYKLPDGTYVGKIITIIQMGWNEPSVYLTDIGDFNTEKLTGTNKYLVKDGQGKTVDKASVFKESLIGNLKAGMVETADLIAQGFSAFQGTIDHLLVNSGLVSPIIETETISPLADKKDIKIKIGNENATESGQLLVENKLGETVASIDESGNATFSGELTADSVKTNDITAGTIYADQIVARNGKFADLQTASTSGITREEVEALLHDAEVNQSLMDEVAQSSVFTATDSASLKELAVEDLYVTNQLAANVLSVTNTVSVGTDMIFSSSINPVSGVIANSLNTLSAPLAIQSLALAPVEIMAGKVKIDTNGNMIITGNLYVAGGIESSTLSLQESESSRFSLTATDSAKLLSLKDINGNEVAMVDASGSAIFNKLSTSELVIAGAETATSSADINGEIITNATAGHAIISTGVTEITIKNPKITDYTLVYVTPTSSTENNVLYVKSKGNGFFTVGFNNSLSTDVTFNWWIIDLKGP